MKSTLNIQLGPVDDVKPAEGIYQQLRQLIISGEIETGSRLPSERKMMEMVGRSRSTVREALRLLERDGYITTVSRSSGAIVKEPGVDVVVDSLESMLQMQTMDIAHVLEFRRLTETSAAKLGALRRTDENLSKLQHIVNQSEKCMGNPEKFSKCDFEFHMAVAEASQNEMYAIMLHVCRSVIEDRLQENLLRGEADVMSARYRRILDTHRAIFEAIRDREDMVAFQIMEEHLRTAETDILEGKEDAS